MNDYSGARADLDELLIQYPDCKIADQASLYLAEATLRGKLYESAIKRFKKVYNMDITLSSRRSAAFGLGKCFFETSDHDNAKKWLTHAIKITDNPADYRLSPAYFMLGKVYIGLGDYKGASGAFRNAMSQLDDYTEYLTITLELVRNEIQQENYLVAMDLIESIPITKLSQEMAGKVIIVKAQIFRALDLTDTATSLLRRKMEFIADSDIRANLGFELAKCYIEEGNFLSARRELSENIPNLPAGDIAIEANLLLAEVCVELKDYVRVEIVCDQIRNSSNEPHIEKRISDLLGKMYMTMNEPEKAALAYAGVYGVTGAE
jgi:TolA-binding protein